MPLPEFIFKEEDDSNKPHIFLCFKHTTKDDLSWQETVNLCLDTWRINADLYRSIEDTGFDDSNIIKIAPILNELGNTRLPKTPDEDNNITKNPYITDITEILSLKLLKQQYEDIIFPYPRVLHKELKGNQHKGIDLLGYIKKETGHILLIIEVMASVQNEHPANTVKDHLKQLLDQTLLPQKPDRLIKELEYIHDESDDSHKDILNGFLLAVTRGDLNNKDYVKAVPVIVRPVNKWDKDDWKPFLQATGKFESAEIPSTVNYYAIECECTFSELMDKVKNRAFFDAEN